MAEQPLPKMAIPVTEEELLNVARLSDAGWMGKRLYAEHRKAYPNGRSDTGIQRLKWIAQHRHLCR